MNNPAQLWTPPSHRDQETFRKAKAPKTGNAYGAWAGRDLSYLNMPGGSLMQFDLSRLTIQDFRQMRDHYQVNASLSVLTFMIHGLDYHVDCENKKIAEEVERQIRENWTQIVRGFSQAFWAGFSPNALEWENNSQSGKVELSKVKDLVPEDCYVNWKKVEGAADPARNNAKPTFFEYDGIVQAGAGYSRGQHAPTPAGHHIPTENTLWYPLLMENGDYYGRKLLRAAFQPWFFSQLIHLFSNRYFERFGEPVPVGRADFEQEVTLADGTTVDGRTAMENMLNSLRNRSVVVLPSDRVFDGNGKTGDYSFDIEYLESQMRGADFERYLMRLDEEISLSIFTPLLMLRTADSGSNNLGVTHTQVYLWMLNALAGDIKEYIDKHIVDRIVKYNFGEKAKKAQWVPRQLGKENVETLRAIVTEMIRKGTAKVDVTELGQALGLTIEEVELVTEPPAGVGGSATAGFQPGTGSNNPNDPAVDPRIGRPNKNDGAKKSIGSTRKIGRQISARVAMQIEKSRQTGLKFWPDLGFQRALSEELNLHRAADLEPSYAAFRAWYEDIESTGLDTKSIGDLFDNLFEAEMQELV